MRLDRLPEPLKVEVQRLWDIYAQDTGHLTFDEWIVASQTEPGRKIMARAVESAVLDRSVGYSVER
jgi:hypothetical protein